MAVTEAAKEADLLEGYAINLFSCKMWQSEYTTQEQSILIRGIRGSGSLDPSFPKIHIDERICLKCWEKLFLMTGSSVDWSCFVFPHSWLKVDGKILIPVQGKQLGTKTSFCQDDWWIVANVEISCMWLGMLGEKEALSGWGWGSSKQL